MFTRNSLVWKLLFLFLLSGISFGLSAQEVKVSGLVTDAKGNPVTGVTVSIKNQTNHQTNTSSSGQYSIQASPGDILTFTYIGYQTEERPLKANENIVNIRLTESAADLDEVVVVGYGQQKKDKCRFFHQYNFC